MTEPIKPDERQRQVWLAAGALAGVVLALLVVAVLLVRGNRDSAPPQVPRASTGSSSTVPTIAGTRDESLRFAEEAVVVLNTLDYRSAQQGLDRWESVAAPPLLDQLRSGRAGAAATAEQTKTASTAKVLAAAVSRLSADSSGADVVVAVEVTVTDSKGTPTVKALRERLTLINTGQGWKVSAVTIVAPAPS